MNGIDKDIDTIEDKKELECIIAYFRVYFSGVREEDYIIGDNSLNMLDKIEIILKKYIEYIEKLTKYTEEYIWILENDHGYDLALGKDLILKIKKQ